LFIVCILEKNNCYKVEIHQKFMKDKLEVKVNPCPFKTERRQCILIKEEKGSEVHEQNFPCNYGGDYKSCEIYLKYKNQEKE